MYFKYVVHTLHVHLCTWVGARACVCACVHACMHFNGSYISYGFPILSSLPADRLVFNTLSSTPAVLDFLYQYNLLPQNDV